MPSKCPQKQILCPSGYLVPEGFETQHKPKMNAICAEIRAFMNCATWAFEACGIDEYFEVGGYASEDDGVLFPQQMNEKEWREAIEAILNSTDLPIPYRD